MSALEINRWALGLEGLGLCGLSWWLWLQWQDTCQSQGPHVSDWSNACSVFEVDLGWWALLQAIAAHVPHLQLSVDCFATQNWSMTVNRDPGASPFSLPPYGHWVTLGCSSQSHPAWPLIALEWHVSVETGGRTDTTNCRYMDPMPVSLHIL